MAAAGMYRFVLQDFSNERFYIIEFVRLLL